MPSHLDTQWDAQLYDCNHAFVSQFGASLVELLAPQPGEHILDLGCGTGHLTHAIAQAGATVVGIDHSIPMIEQAQQHYPELRFEVADACDLSFSACFDAVFSNAVLHWIKKPETVIAAVWRALKPDGRFVAELGGSGNVQSISTALSTVLEAAGYSTTTTPWYFPSIGQYATLLEAQGFTVTLAVLFDRPTRLEAGDRGLQNWIQMFGNAWLQPIPIEQRSSLLSAIEERLRPTLYRDGAWYADYRRLRIVAIK